MALSFEILLAAMENTSSPLMDSGEESKATHVVQAGLNLRNDHSFWDDFIQLCSNTEGLSQLLGVPREAVVSWASKIRTALDKAELQNQHDSQPRKDEMLPTGKTGAMTSKNMTPFGRTNG